MNIRRSSFVLFVAFIFVLLSCGDCKRPFKIVKRPGKNPLKCFKKGNKSKCVEVTPEEAGIGREPMEDPHDVEKGPMGGKIYKVGFATMECFSNGQCFSVNEKTMKTTPTPTTLAPTTLAPTTLAPTTLAPTTLAPTTLAPTTLAPEAIWDASSVIDKGVFYRRGNLILECFPSGECEVVDIVVDENAESGDGGTKGDNVNNDDETTSEGDDEILESESDHVDEDDESGDGGTKEDNANNGDETTGEDDNESDIENEKDLVDEEQDEKNEGHPDSKPKGVFYRRGNMILECFPDGECKDVDIVVDEDDGNGDGGTEGDNVNDDDEATGEGDDEIRESDQVDEDDGSGDGGTKGDHVNNGDEATGEGDNESDIENEKDLVDEVQIIDEENEGHPDSKPKGVFYRRVSQILECFPNGDCKVVDVVVDDIDDDGTGDGGSKGDNENNGNESTSKDDDGTGDGGSKGDNENNGNESTSKGDDGTGDGGSKGDNKNNGNESTSKGDDGTGDGGSKGDNENNGNESTSKDDDETGDGGSKGDNENNENESTSKGDDEIFESEKDDVDEVHIIDKENEGDNGINSKPKGIFYIRGNLIFECFPNGVCEVVDDEVKESDDNTNGNGGTEEDNENNSDASTGERGDNIFENDVKDEENELYHVDDVHIMDEGNEGDYMYQVYIANEENGDNSDKVSGDETNSYLEKHRQINDNRISNNFNLPQPGIKKVRFCRQQSLLFFVVDRCVHTCTLLHFLHNLCIL